MYSRRALLISTLVTLGSASLLASCDRVRPSSSATLAPTALTPLRIADAQVSGNFLPTYIAIDDGIFRSHGLDVSLTSGQSSTTIASLLAGQIEVAETGAVELVNALAGGADLVAISTLVPVYPFRLFVQADIKEPDDLKGKTVGITSYGSVIDLATRTALTQMGLDPQRDVTLLPLTSASARTTAMLSGQIAGGLSLPPDWITLEASGLHSIFDLAQAALSSGVIMEIVQRSFVSAQRELVQSFVDSMVEAIAREKRDESIAVGELRKYLNYDDARGLKETYEFFAQVVHPSLPYPEVTHLQQAYDASKRENLAMANVDLGNAVDRSFVERAAARTPKAAGAYPDQRISLKR